MNKGQHDRKIRLINRMIEKYFNIDSENRSPNTVYRFMEWLENGDCGAESSADAWIAYFNTDVTSNLGKPYTA